MLGTINLNPFNTCRLNLEHDKRKNQKVYKENLYDKKDEKLSLFEILKKILINIKIYFKRETHIFLKLKLKNDLKKVEKVFIKKSLLEEKSFLSPTFFAHYFPTKVMTNFNG